MHLMRLRRTRNQQTRRALGFLIQLRSEVPLAEADASAPGGVARLVLRARGAEVGPEHHLSALAEAPRAPSKMRVEPTAFSRATCNETPSKPKPQARPSSCQPQIQEAIPKRLSQPKIKSHSNAYPLSKNRRVHTLSTVEDGLLGAPKLPLALFQFFVTCWRSARNEKWNDPKKNHPTGGFLSPGSFPDSLLTAPSKLLYFGSGHLGLPNIGGLLEN